MTFPIAVTDFSLSEGAKVATYEYAGRNGAEHERVLSYRTIKLSGTFVYGSGTKIPEEYVRQLRLLNDNKPGELMHPAFGLFKCIMKDLTITQTGELIDAMENGKKISGFGFSAEFWETTPPNARTLQDKMNQLFPAVEPKLFQNDYKSSLKYKNVDELYNAILSKDIIPGTDPIKNAEWLSYNYEMRQEAYNRWKANGFPTGVSAGTSSQSNTSTGTKQYTVQSGDTGIRIAKKFSIPFDRLYAENKGKEVRKSPKGTEGKYWKTAGLVYPGDVLIIPGN